MQEITRAAELRQGTSPRMEWRRKAFDMVVIACVGFVILTALAMCFYPGGARHNRHAEGYSFFVNYFSDLGRTQALNGAPNSISSPLFSLALGVAGLALALFFVAFATFFWQGFGMRVLCGYGSAFGIIAGLCFLGIACTPSNLYPSLHSTFVQWAFKTFLMAAVIYSGVIFSKRDYPRAAVWIFSLFALGLASYVALLMYGPGASTPNGLFIQATGQKLISYAAVISIACQAILARRFERTVG